MIVADHKQDVKNMRICFIDNEEDERDDIRESLKSLGKTSNWMVVDYSEEIVSRAINNEYDILVCDYKMPGKDGITVLEEVRKKNKKIVLALYTAFAISERSDADLRCIDAVIRRFKKYDGVGCLLGTLQNQYISIRQDIERQFPGSIYPGNLIGTLRNKFRRARKAVTSEVTVISYEGVTETIPPAEKALSELENAQSGGIIELRELILDLAKDLVADLEKTTEQDAYIMHSRYGKVTIRELKTHIMELTPLGMDHLKFWLKSRRRLNKNRN